MIIDAYNNVWQAGGTSDYLTAESYTPEDMLKAMDQAGVDMAVGCSLGQMVDNSFIAETVAKYPAYREYQQRTSVIIPWVPRADTQPVKQTG